MLERHCIFPVMRCPVWACAAAHVACLPRSEVISLQKYIYFINAFEIAGSGRPVVSEREKESFLFSYHTSRITRPEQIS